MQPQSIDRAELMRTIQRCAEAYHRIRAELPQKVFYHDNLENQQKASLASLAELPVLIDPKSFQLYIACIAQGVGFGAVDVVDAGRLSHLATSAMSAWKLANLTAPAAERKERESAEKEQKQPTPLPPKGNHPGAEDGQSQPRQPAEDQNQAPEHPKNAATPPPKVTTPALTTANPNPVRPSKARIRPLRTPKPPPPSPPKVTTLTAKPSPASTWPGGTRRRSRPAQPARSNHPTRSRQRSSHRPTSSSPPRPPGRRGCRHGAGGRGAYTPPHRNGGSGTGDSRRILDDGTIEWKASPRRSLSPIPSAEGADLPAR